MTSLNVNWIADYKGPNKFDREPLIFCELRCESEIRIGSENDGGYLIPDDLYDIGACYSPGVDVNVSFEKELLISKNINSHLADFSVNAPPDGFTPLSFTKNKPSIYRAYSIIAFGV